MYSYHAYVSNDVQGTDVQLHSLMYLIGAVGTAVARALSSTCRHSNVLSERGSSMVSVLLCWL